MRFEARILVETPGLTPDEADEAVWLHGAVRLAAAQMSLIPGVKIHDVVIVLPPEDDGDPDEVEITPEADAWGGVQMGQA